VKLYISFYVLLSKINGNKIHATSNISTLSLQSVQHTTATS